MLELEVLNYYIAYHNFQANFITREMDLLLVPYWADRDLDLIQWPPFLLASKVFLLSGSLFSVRSAFRKYLQKWAVEQNN